jgi:predicted MFS family arabinose efflux permease
MVVSSYTFSAFVSGMLSTFFVDKYDRKNILILLYIGFITGTFLCGMTNSYYLLLAARIFTGLFGGVIGATILSIVGDVIPLERRGQDMGIVMAAFSFAGVIGVPFGLFLANVFSWQAPFITMVLLAVPILLLVHRYLPNIKEHIGLQQNINVIKTIGAILAERNQRKALFLSMVMMLGHFCIIPFISPYMVANVGFNENQLQYIYLIGGLATVFTSPYIGKLADRKGKR